MTDRPVLRGHDLLLSARVSLDGIGDITTGRQVKPGS